MIFLKDIHKTENIGHKKQARSATKCIILKQSKRIENVMNWWACGSKYLPEKRATYSVASWVMLLKVKGARVLMLLLLRSLCTHKRTVNAHRQAELATSICVIGPNKDAVCGVWSRLRGWYIHQWQLLHACELLGHRCQHIPLQVTAKHRALSLWCIRQTYWMKTWYWRANVVFWHLMSRALSLRKLSVSGMTAKLRFAD